jgi:hypothetical protein
MVTKRLDGIGHYPATVTEDINVEAVRYIHDKLKTVSYFTYYRIYLRNLRTFFTSLAAEKSGCVKYSDFPAFGPRNALLSLFAFLIILFDSSNNARWIPEFPILFVLHGSRTVPRNLSLLICTTLYNYYSSFPS